MSALKQVILLLFFFGCCHGNCSGQEYSYRHYDINDGLVGNHVYHSVQDKDGFIWFATETGVSRFDGSHFKNFTTADGLPDNEIVRLFADSKGRVWMAPFKNTICYYYKGKIYNANSDSLLKGMEMKHPARQIFEDAAHNIFIIEDEGINILHHENKRSRIEKYNNTAIQITTGGVDFKGRPYILASVIKEGKRLFTSLLVQTVGQSGLTIRPVQRMEEFVASVEVRFTYIAPFGLVFPTEEYFGSSKPVKLQYWNTLDYNRDTIQVPPGLNMLSFGDKNQLYFNTSNGVKLYNLADRQFTSIYLQNENVSFSMDDSEGNKWFTTLGRGVYRLVSPDVKKIPLVNDKEQITALNGTGNQLVVGTNNNYFIYTFDMPTGTYKSAHSLPQNRDGKIVSIHRRGDSFYFLSSSGFYRADTGLRHIERSIIGNKVMTFKDVGFLGTDNFVFATHSSALITNFGDAKWDLFFTERSTAVCAAHKGLYVGTLYGLYFINEARQKTYLGTASQLFANRITKLLYVAGKLWVGTNDNGLICYDGQRIVKSLSTKDSLTGNIIRTLYADGNYLWVGTDRGLNKINMADTGLPIVRRYTIADGLASNMVNAVYASENMVFVGTPDGLSFFDETKMSTLSRCDLRILGITVSGKDRPFDSTKLYLKYRDNNIRFDFVGISFKSAGDITYQYRLLGIDDDWKTTRDNFLQYPSLPSGSYELQLKAVNKFGINSNELHIPFTIAKRLAEENWFRAMVLILAIGLAWGLASWRIRRIRKRYREKIETNTRIATLEQQALKAQMNPHFIFNCLNSIQQYVIDKDVLGANKFITDFARLIRQTMENSSKQLISVGEEEAFLNAYLTLEKLRFEDKFDYSIHVDGQISKEEVFLPPMLLQPYIENSIRHGIRLKKNGKGLINISISLASNLLICTVIDNGVGREVAQQYKSSQHIEYQSRGMLLTSQRVALFNKNAKAEINLAVEDMKDESGAAVGTKVTIRIPVET